jgi:hypothetical protein
MAKVIPSWHHSLKEVERIGYGTVDLVADGYNVSFQWTRNKNRMYFTFYIDGRWKGEYCNTDSVIGQKFGVPKYHRFKKSLYEIYKKFEGKKKADAARKKQTSTIMMYTIFHPSAAAVIRVLTRTCTNVSLL